MGNVRDIGTRPERKRERRQGRPGVRRWLAGALLPVLLAAAPAAASDIFAMPNGVTLRKPVLTLVDLKFKQIVRQAYDVSCGAAAMATLLTHFYGVETDEKTIIDLILARASDEEKTKILRYGFSMLELKRAGEKLGFVSGGFRIDSLEGLSRVKIPVLTLISIRGYRHFVVLKGIRNGRAYIADPAFGNRARPLDRFADEWTGVILVLASNRHPGRQDFRFEGAPGADGQLVASLVDRLSGPLSRAVGDF